MCEDCEDDFVEFYYSGWDSTNSDIWNIFNLNWGVDVNFDALATGEWNESDMFDNFAAEEYAFEIGDSDGVDNGDSTIWGYGENISFERAKGHYQNKSGSMLEQDFSKIDLTKADFSNPIKLKDGRTVYRIGLDDITGAYSNYDQAVVHGTILVEKVSKNSKIVQVVYNKELGCRCGMYDFEQHSLPSIRKPGQFFKTIGRNLATWWGKKVNETNHLGEKVGGKPFIIKYNGTNSIY